jgi:diguanylate cyclase (GGDEF)-like protein
MPPDGGPPRTRRAPGAPPPGGNGRGPTGWEEARMREEGAPEADIAAAGPSGWANWWRGLYHDDEWLMVVRELQRHMQSLVGADTLALWARLPPAGEWLRIAWQLRSRPVLLPADVEPHASLERELAPQRYITADIGGAYRRLLDRAGVAGGWLLPLTAPAPTQRGRQWVGVLGLGWRGEPPAQAPSPVGLASVVWYLLGQRLEGTYTEAVLEAAAFLPRPATAADWERCMASLSRWLGGEHWALFRIAEERGERPDVSLVAERGNIPGRGAGFAAFVRERPEAFARSALSRAMRQRRVVAVEDTALSPLRPFGFDAGAGGAARSLLVLPLGTGPGHGFGLMAVYWRVPGGWQQFGLSIRPWEAARRVAAEWWQGMHVAHDALHDALTGTPNRHGIAAAWRDWQERAASGLVGVVDLDRFGEVNNRWGHLMGDEVLRVLAQVLEELARAHGGWAGRWGGDEFVVCLPAATDWAAVGDELQAAMDECARRREWPMRVGLSGGAALWRGRRPRWERVFARADRMLYRAKNLGRSRFLLAPGAGQGVSAPRPRTGG